MAKLNIVIVPDPVLRKVAEPVKTITADILTLLNDMADTMGDDYGIAAPQVGISKQLIVIGGDDEKPFDKPMKIINPKIVWSSDDTSSLEQGCLSVPGVSVDVARPTTIKVEFMDETGKVHNNEYNGFMSQCFQHEMDHINGKTILDYLSPLKRRMALKKVQKYYSDDPQND